MKWSDALTSLIVKDFSGIAPKINKKSLAENMAQLANNCRLDRNVVESLRGILFDSTEASNVQSLFKHRGSWVISTEDRDFVGEILANDPWQKIYFTGPLYPKVRTGTAEYRLGVPAPITAPVAVVLSAPAPENENIESRAYVCTYVDGFGFEGPPSTTSTIVDCIDGEQVDLTLPSGMSGNYFLLGAPKTRIYRTNTGNSGTYWQFVAEVNQGVTSYADTIKDVQLQEVLPSSEWVGPPDDNSTYFPDGPLQGLTEMPNGILAGFSGNALYFSEPYMPHAWPSRYQITSTDKIIGLASTQSGLVVCTNRQPFIVTGTQPEAFVRVEIEANYGCASKESIVDMGDYAIYASHDGLIKVQGSRAEVITGDHFSRDDWQDYQPSSIRGFFYEGLYVATYGNPDDRKGFIFDPKGGKNAFVLIDEGFLASHYDADNDEYHILYKNGASTWQRGRWDQGDPLTYRWRSKVFRTPRPTNFGVLKVDADRYPVRVRIITDGEYRVSRIVMNDQPQRLPSGFKAKEFEIEIEGENPVNYVGLFESMAEVM